MRRALELLAKLERQELDRERQALRAAEAELERTEQDLRVLREREPAEHVAGWSLPGGPGLLASYLGAARRREVWLDQRRREQQAVCAQAANAVRERIGAAKSLELAAEQLAAAAAAELARRQAIELEEAGSRRGQRSSSR